MFVLYLCSEKNAHKLDAVTEDLGIALHRFPGQYSLIQLVGSGYQTVSGLLPNAAYLAIDAACITDEDMEFVSGLESIEMVHDVRIILISEGEKRAALLSRAARAGFINIVSASSAEEEQTELRLCIEGEGMTRQQAQRYIVDEKDEQRSQEDDKTRAIGVCGVIHRTGVTTLALQMAAYLQGKGKNACLIEANDHGHIATIAEAYQMEKGADGALDCGGLALYPACMPSFRPKRAYDAVCYDFGMLEETAPEILAKCDAQIVCGGVKPWESYWLPLLFDCADKFRNLHFIFAFVPRDDQDDVRHMMEKYADRCYFTPYAPGLFDGQACAQIFEHILAQKPKGKRFKREKE